MPPWAASSGGPLGTRLPCQEWYDSWGPHAPPNVVSWIMTPSKYGDLMWFAYHKPLFNPVYCISTPTKRCLGGPTLYPLLNWQNHGKSPVFFCENSLYMAICSGYGKRISFNPFLTVQKTSDIITAKSLYINPRPQVSGNNQYEETWGNPFSV